MVRSLIDFFVDPNSWTVEQRAMSLAAFAVVALDPRLVAPVRQVYDEVRLALREDGLPPGVSEHVLFTVDGLCLHWVLGEVDRGLIEGTALSLRNYLEWAEGNPKGASR